MDEKEIQAIRTTTWSAGPGCHGGCGVIAYVKDGRLLKIEGDPSHPWNQGRLCARALAMKQYIEHPKRLRKPLLRKGKRGEGVWEEISWDFAFDFIEERMKKIREESGPESFIFAMGTGRDIGPWISMLAYAYGSPNVMFALSGNACYSPRIAALDTFQGDYCVFDAGQWFEKRYDDPRFVLPQCMIIWGYNIHATCPDNLFGHWIVDMMKRGTKIIVIDPRFTWFSSRAEIWLPVRPGTDSALAMGLLYVILDEGLLDYEFLKEWTNASLLLKKDKDQLLRESDIYPDGKRENFLVWDEEAKRVSVWDTEELCYRPQASKVAISCEISLLDLNGKEIKCHTVWDAFQKRVKEYDPKTVEGITGVPASDTVRAARLYAKSKPASIHWGVPIDMTPNVTPLCHAIACLWALTGNLDVPGGNVIARFAFDCVAYALPGSEGVIKLKTKKQDLLRIGSNRFGPFQKFIWRCQTDSAFEQIFTGKPYPIRGMWIQACNPLAGIGMDPKRWLEAFLRLDFIVGVDLFMTPTLMYADIVLPSATFLEKNGIRSWWVPLQSINKALTIDDCKPDIEINFELAKRFDPEFKWKTVEELFDDILKPSGLTYKELQNKVWVFPPEGHPSHPYFRYKRGLLRKDGKKGFQTPTGRFELYSVLREDWGYEPLPLHEEPPFSPSSRSDLAKEYPLILSTGRRSPVYFHTEHRMIPYLRVLEPDPIVEIHPETAKKYGISDGEWVYVENWMGKAKFRAKVTPIVPEWMVMATHGWWFPERKAEEPELFGVWESNINLLIPMGYNGKDGLGAPIKHLLCKIYRA
ncbi:MAG: molybdopterin-dependent oxidoreductase [Deltaproteobacteria bacterium]|nr:molybdopterin-dependent oxidoreductase [Deltaproteobacteria bacterium]